MEAIAVDIASQGNATPQVVAVSVALNDEAIRLGQDREIDHLAAGDIAAERRCPAEHDVDLARIASAVASVVGSHDQVVKAVAIDVAR